MSVMCVKTEEICKGASILSMHCMLLGNVQYMFFQFSEPYDSTSLCYILLEDVISLAFFFKFILF